SLVDAAGVYRIEGPARVFVSERAAINAIKKGRIQAGDVMVLAGCGPLGTGMEETYQLTSALKHLPFGKKVALITDARFSGVSTGACLGHVGPEALAGGPIGRLQEGAAMLASRAPRADLAPASDLPDDTRLWAALQQAGGGTWGGCVYDVDAIT